MLISTKSIMLRKALITSNSLEIYIKQYHYHHRVIPKLYFASDSPQQDPVVSVAADQTQTLLFPIMQPLVGGSQLPPLVQGLMPPYLFDILEEVGPSTESALSRIVQMLLQALLVSQTKYMTVGGSYD